MHTHAHAGRAESGRALTILMASAGVTLGYVALAFVMGLRAHSMALISEAGHNLTDFLALGLSWLGAYLQSKPPDSSRTFGYHRAGVLTALVNVATLFAITFLIIWQAIVRMRAPQAVATGPMIWVAAAGLVMNTAIAWMLESGRGDVNIRAAFLHMVGDAFATALVILTAVLIAETGVVTLDPILALVIAGLILASGWGVLREALNILLEGTPLGMRSEAVAADLAGVEGVLAVHDLHIWSLGSQSHALSAHVQIADIPPSASELIRRRLCALLADRYHIRHATLQFEAGACEASTGCQIGQDKHGHGG